MPEQRETNPVYYTLMLTALTGALAYMLREDGLTSARPKDEPPQHRTAWGDQGEMARMWEDPLGIEAAGRTNALSPAAVAAQISTRVGDHPKQVTVLCDLVEGFPYAESREVRLRLRYATQKALLDAGYIPEDRDHLGLMEVDWMKGDVLREHESEMNHSWLSTVELPPRICDTSPSNFERAWFSPLPQITTHKEIKWAKLDVSFEWYKSEGSRLLPEVLVLWLKEEAFADYPLERLYLLARQLGATNGPAFAILGPRSSNTLKRIVDGTYLVTTDALYKQWLEGLSMASPEATAPDAVMWPSKMEAGIGRDYAVRMLGKNSKVRLHRVKSFVVTDQVLATNLVQELFLRGVSIGSKSQDQIVLISEADTLYGRSLPACFAAAHAGCGDGSNEEIRKYLTEYSTHSRALSPAIHTFTYLRGLDGKTAADKSNQPNELPTSKASDDRKTTNVGDESSSNRAEGDAQMDYARRLTTLIKETVRKTNFFGHPQPRAIGVLGNDLYDKLILLQALRPEFPDAIFFTTDLDARLLDPKSRPVTRNMIVATSYDLKPTAEELKPLGVGLPAFTPFRDCYQTAVYLACRHLLGAPTQIGNARLFEVGRHDFVPLGNPGDLEVPWLLSSAKSYLLILVPGLVLIGIGKWVLSAGQRQRDPELTRLIDLITLDEARELDHVRQRRKNWRYAIAMLTFCAATLLYFVAQYQAHQSYGEPFKAADGVSVWPTELIRVFIFGLGVALVVDRWHAHQRHRLLLHAEFFGTSCEFKESQLFKGVIERERADRSRGLWHRLAWGTRYSAIRWRSRARVFCRHARFALGAIVVQRRLAFHSGSTGHKRKVHANRLFHAYVRRALFRNRISRLFPMASLYFSLAFLAIAYLGLPYAPLRGHSLVRLLDVTLLVSSIFAWCLLAFYVIDAVRISRHLISRLGEGVTEWPPRVLKQIATTRRMDPEHLRGFLDVRFTANHTEEVYRLIKYPMILLLLMFLARLDVFDRWTWPPALVGVFLLNGLMMLGCALQMRRAAARIRAAAVEEIDSLLVRFARSKYSTCLQLTLEEIKNNQRGAYAPLPADVAVIAALIPTGGAGLITLLQRLMT